MTRERRCRQTFGLNQQGSGRYVMWMQNLPGRDNGLEHRGSC